MTIYIAEMKRVEVQTTFAALTLASIRPFLRECTEAQLPETTEIKAQVNGDGRCTGLVALLVEEHDNRPRDVGAGS